jgi:hypothetical protein
MYERFVLLRRVETLPSVKPESSSRELRSESTECTRRRRGGLLPLP